MARTKGSRTLSPPTDDPRFVEAVRSADTDALEQLLGERWAEVRCSAIPISEWLGVTSPNIYVNLPRDGDDSSWPLGTVLAYQAERLERQSLNDAPVDNLAEWSEATGHPLNDYRDNPVAFIRYAQALDDAGVDLSTATFGTSLLVSWSVPLFRAQKYAREGEIAVRETKRLHSAGGTYRQYIFSVDGLLKLVDRSSVTVDVTKTDDPLRDLWRVSVSDSIKKGWLRYGNTFDGAIYLLRANRAYQKILSYAGPNPPEVMPDKGNSITGRRIVTYASQAANLLAQHDPDWYIEPFDDAMTELYYPVEIRQATAEQPLGLVILGDREYATYYEAREFSVGEENAAGKPGKIARRDTYLCPGKVIVANPYAFRRVELTTFVPGRAYLPYQVRLYAAKETVLPDGSIVVDAFGRLWRFCQLPTGRWQLVED